MSQINAQIDSATTDKLTYIQQQTNQALSEILLLNIGGLS